MYWIHREGGSLTDNLPWFGAEIHFEDNDKIKEFEITWEKKHRDISAIDFLELLWKAGKLSTSTPVKLNESLYYFLKALEIEPNDFMALNGIGIILDKLGRSEEAIQYYDKAILENPLGKMILINKGNAFFNLKQYEKALECYDELIKKFPKGYILYNKTLTLEKLGRYSDAIKIYDEIITDNENDGHAILGKARCLIALKNYPEAKRYLNELLYYYPEEPETFNLKLFFEKEEFR